MGAYQRPIPVEGVQADDERVRTQHGPPAHRVAPLLLQGQGGDASLMNDQLVGDDRGACGVEPGTSPVVHVATRDLGEHVQKVVQGGVAVGSALEEETRGLEEGLLADVGDELLEDGGPPWRR